MSPWTICARESCQHPRLGHFKDGCHAIGCAVYAVDYMMTGPSRCPAFVEPAEKGTTDDPTQEADARSKAREAVDRAQIEFNAASDAQRRDSRPEDR